jgi:hypothetical protein
MASAFSMNGLRVYINPENAAPSEQEVFYSRRADGPFYCWRFEAKQGQWCGARVNQHDPVAKLLCMARWKAVPMSLQTRLDEHYME